MRNQIKPNPRGTRQTDNAVGEQAGVANPAGGGKPGKQFTPSKVKNSGPKYKQPDPRSENKSTPLSKGVAPKLK
jgi:hypothetical protein